MRAIVAGLAFGLAFPAIASPPEDAKAAYDQGDYANAFRIWSELAAQGNAEAQTKLGGMYLDGRGVTGDDTAAVAWIRKAAEQGHAPAQTDLGLLYARGQGVRKDDVEAVRWYRKAAEQGFAAAETNLGFMYGSGRGVAKDDTEAVR